MVIHASSHSYSPPEFNAVKDIDSPIPIVLVTRTENFTFNEELLKLDKYVLVNMAELGWDYDWSRGTPIFGKNAEYFGDLYFGEEWDKFNHWVYSNQPVLTLQREILLKDVWYDIKPIEYPNWQPEHKPQSKEEFDSRPIDLFFAWGRSNEIRPKIHGEIWKKSGELGWSVCDNPYFFTHFMANETGKKAVSFNLPHYARQPLDQLQAINGLSKLSLSLPGCGVKCFRSTGESSVNSVVVMQPDALAWTYPFVHGVNAIKFWNDGIDNMGVIKDALNNPNLYEIYQNCVATTEKYRWPNYKIHLEQLINSAI